jgi:16S rRNA (uracil1498-N3)-methyltransferase
MTPTSGISSSFIVVLRQVSGRVVASFNVLQYIGPSKGHAVSERFYISEPITTATISLAGDEGRHLARVMRARPGDLVTLFDGSGGEFLSRVTKVGRAVVELDVMERRQADRESPWAVTLGVALPKGDRQRFLVEKAVELGVARLIPLETERGVAQPTASALDRLRRAVIEASKQCGRNRLMEIAEPSSAGAFFDSAPVDALRVLAHPGGEPLPAAIGNSRPREGERHVRPAVVLAVGPEGGLTDDEVAGALGAGWRQASLGRRVLRVETAALALAAWFGLASE